MLKKYAYTFILHNKFNPFELDFEALAQILKNNNIQTLDIESNQKLINILQISNFNNTFFYNLENKPIIFYKKSLNYKEKIFSILHELGHIVLNHTGNNFTFEQEEEANLFACEVLFPSVLINYAKYNSVEEIVNNSLLDCKQAHFYLKNISECNMNNLINELILHKFKSRFLEQIEQPHSKKRKYLFISLASIIIFLIIIANITLLNNKHSAINVSSEIKQEIGSNINTVFITKTGSKYHLKNCHHLKNRASIKLNIKNDKVILKNYEPCKICFPK